MYLPDEMGDPLHAQAQQTAPAKLPAKQTA
jgi:hypothetical protein